ncbi:MAG TPA: hypothetical protein VHL85_08550 [Burkholderiales bacterium]|jgi:hypothetical protein|nr:hypothetical protein [Burkholderiales bacterium]
MTDTKTGTAKAQPTHRGTAFGDMTQAQKIVWVSKVVVCVCTFGFAFPAVMED